jgi:hypothetical protein
VRRIFKDTDAGKKLLEYLKKLKPGFPIVGALSCYLTSFAEISL